MEEFVNVVNRFWNEADPVVLASFVLWRLNYIHPFINGNGRTARAASYFVLCVKQGQWLPGTTILPELIRLHRDEYVRALEQVDKSVAEGKLDLSPLHGLLSQLLSEQLATAAPASSPN
jgi:Fic family protein